MATNRWQTEDADSRSAIQAQADAAYVKQYAPRGMPVDAPTDEYGNAMSKSMKQVLGTVTRDDYAQYLTGKTLSKVSSERRETINSLLDSREKAAQPFMPLAANSKSLLYKQAVSNTQAVGQSTNTIHLSPELYSPLFLTQNLQLPRDIRTANAWNRAYYDTNPYIRNGVNLHATFPLAKFTTTCEDPEIGQFFDDMCHKIDLESAVQHIGLEFWKIGECFPYAEFDESTGTWSKVYLHNPDFISVRSSPLPGVVDISLRPDPELAKIITSNDPAVSKLRDSIDPRVVQHILRNEYIPLDAFNVSHLKNLSAPYDVRGTSIIVSVWKDLILYDKIRESLFAQADGMINPMTLVKVGSSNADGLYPTAEELEAYRQILETSQFDKDFKLVTHSDVNIERIGYNGSVMDVSGYLNMIIDNILTGIMVPKAVLTQEGATYASASVGLEVMRQRYDSFRAMISRWIEHKIFAPIAEVHGFYKGRAGVKKLIYPRVQWNHMNLYDLDSYIGQITGLANEKKVSMKTLYKSLGLDFHEEMKTIRAEQIETAILVKEEAALQAMSLSALRELDVEGVIPEPEAHDDVEDMGALPGTEGLPGMDMGGMDMGGMDMGGAPDIGAALEGDAGMPL